MVFAVDVEDHVVRRWYRDGEEARFERDAEWTPTLYVAGQKPEYLEWLAPELERDPKVADVATVQKRPQLRDREPVDVLRVDVERPSEIERVAHEVARRSCERYMPRSLRLHNVDFAPKFRYCLETETDPTPNERPRALAFSISDRALAHGDLLGLECEGEQLGDSERAVLEAVDVRLREVDPDVLVLSSGDAIPLVEDRAAELPTHPLRPSAPLAAIPLRYFCRSTVVQTTWWWSIVKWQLKISGHTPPLFYDVS